MWVPPSVRSWYFLSPLDGASVREAHCEQASTAWNHEIRLIAIREVLPPFGEEHRGLEQDISFPGNKHLLILQKCYAVHINASSL